MDPSFRCSETPAELSASTQQRLNMYAIAATAAGVGMLALSPIAQAKIIYTPTHTPIGGGTILDLNHDGITDFVFSFFSYHGSFTSVRGLTVGHPRGGANNHVRGIHTHRGGNGSYASALRAGALIGPKGPFTNAYPAIMAGTHTSNSHTFMFRGPWANGGKGVKNRYLGLYFFIKGKVHFGWARLNTTFNAQHSVSGLLTGYAYETIPNKPITAGNISCDLNLAIQCVVGPVEEPDDADNRVEQPNPASSSATTHDPATLGVLALGAPGLSIWRREEPVVATSDKN